MPNSNPPSVSFQHLQLTPAVLADWYGRSLNAYGLRSSAPSLPGALPARPGAEAEPVPYSVLGNNQRHLLLLVDEPEQAFVSEEGLQMLVRLLEACHYNLADVAIVNHARQPADMARLRGQLQPKTVLLFGIDPVACGLPIRFPPYKPQWHDGCRYLLSDSLLLLNEAGEEGKLRKSRLWLSIRELLGI